MTEQPPRESALFERQAALSELDAATVRLLDAVRALTDESLGQPSALPQWSRGHVVTHLARNADGLGNLARWAESGIETPMYPSAEARAADIEAGAGRGLRDQLRDLQDSAHRLRGRLGESSQETDHRILRITNGAEVEGWEIPLLRIREMEVHHVDLAVGYAPADWSDEFCTRTLDQVAPVFAARNTTPFVSPFASLVDEAGRTWVVGAGAGESSLHGPTPWLLGWLLGRHGGSDLEPHGRGDVPPAPTWV